ncbi:unnamed protein product, partial [marine sediment metagenome]
YSEEEQEEMETSPDEAYDNYAHTQGYMAEWDAATELVLNHKRKYDYQRNDGFGFKASSILLTIFILSHPLLILLVFDSLYMLY